MKNKDLDGIPNCEKCNLLQEMELIEKYDKEIKELALSIEKNRIIIKRLLTRTDVSENDILNLLKIAKPEIGEKNEK